MESIVVSRAVRERLVCSKPGRDNPDFVYVWTRRPEMDTVQLPPPEPPPPRVMRLRDKLLWGLAFFVKGVWWLRRP